ncbi:MAG: hypothetical protein H6581_03350 [Bacteroidia bacterium]|nr:hypothetical protein [Bacteroidia bacterium]
MKSIWLQDLLLKGLFGPVRLGDRKEKLIAFLGEPEKVIIPYLKREKLEMIGYHGFDFTFIRGKLAMINHRSILKWDFSFNPEFQKPNKTFLIRTWGDETNQALTLAEVKKILLSQGVSWVEKPFFDSLCLFLRDEIELQFFDPRACISGPGNWHSLKGDNPELRLGAIFCSKFRHPQAESQRIKSTEKRVNYG